MNQEDDERPYHGWERRFGSFQRLFTRCLAPSVLRILGRTIATASCMPKVPEAKSRRIQVGTN